jgi:hypothetical protein
MEGDEMTMQDRVMKHLWRFLLTAIICVIFYGAYWLWYPHTPARVDRIHVKSEVVRIGEEFCFQFEGQKLMAVPVKVTVEFVNHNVYDVYSYTSNTPVGDKFKERCFLVPTNIIPNKYYLRWNGDYTINQLNHVPLSYTSETQFEVVK